MGAIRACEEIQSACSESHSGRLAAESLGTGLVRSRQRAGAEPRPGIRREVSRMDSPPGRRVLQEPRLRCTAADFLGEVVAVSGSTQLDVQEEYARVGMAHGSC